MGGRVEDREGVAAELPPLDRAYHIDFRLLSDRLAEIPDEVNGILKLFDGRRTLAEVLAEAERSGVAAATVLARLWSEEIIRPAPATSASPGAPQEGGPTPQAPVLDPHEGGAAEAAPAEWFTGPDAEPPREARDAAGPPLPAPPPSSDGASGAPRIVRFPARAKPPRPASYEPTAARPLPAALVVRRPVRPVRVVRRRAPAVAMGRRSATALLLAASLLAAVAIWRVVASRAPDPGESGSRPTSSTAAPGPPAQPRAPAAAPDQGASTSPAPVRAERPASE